MSLQSAGGGDYSTLVINTLITRTQNIIAADNLPSTTFQGKVTIPNLVVSGTITNTPNPITINGDLNINGHLGDDKLLTGFTVGNRNFAVCDEEGNANANCTSTSNPRTGMQKTRMWGETVMSDMLTIDQCLNTGTTFADFGWGFRLNNKYQVPYSDAFGGVYAALTTMSYGHDPDNQTAEFANIFNYYGPGHFKNRVVLDCLDNFLSSTPAMVITLPAKKLYTTINVLPNSITTVGNIGTIVNANYFKNTLKCPLPIPGMTITINAVPAAHNVTNATILSVTPISGGTARCNITYEFTSGIVTTQSTNVNYVWIGPKVEGSGTVGTITFPSGPIPLVNQKILVSVQPNTLSTILNRTTPATTSTYMVPQPVVITSVTLGVPGVSNSTLTYNLTNATSIDPVAAYSLTTVDLSAGTQGSNNSYGSLGNFGVHTLNPEAPLDITGDMICREVTTNNAMFKTVTEGTTFCEIQYNDPFASVQPAIFTRIDLANQEIEYISRITETVMMRFSAETGYQTWYNPDGTKVIDIACLNNPSAFTFYKENGTTLFQLDQDTNSIITNPSSVINNGGIFDWFSNNGDTLLEIDGHMETVQFCNPVGSFTPLTTMDLDKFAILTTGSEYMFIMEKSNPSAISIGQQANGTRTAYAIGIGHGAGSLNQGINSISLGAGAGANDQGSNSIAIGNISGETLQGTNCVAIGNLAGNTNQGNTSIAIGTTSGQTTQGIQSISIGDACGSTSQGNQSIAIGTSAGNSNQGTKSVAIGFNAGQSSQGNNAIAIGNLAGTTSQTANSIIINASGTSLEASGAKTYINPIAATTSNNANFLTYNTTTKEVSYGNTIAGNLNVQNQFSVTRNLVGQTDRRVASFYAPDSYITNAITAIGIGTANAYRTEAQLRFTPSTTDSLLNTFGINFNDGNDCLSVQANGIVTTKSTINVGGNANITGVTTCTGNLTTNAKLTASQNLSTNADRRVASIYSPDSNVATRSVALSLGVSASYRNEVQMKYNFDASGSGNNSYSLNFTDGGADVYSINAFGNAYNQGTLLVGKRITVNEGIESWVTQPSFTTNMIGYTVTGSLSSAIALTSGTTTNCINTPGAGITMGPGLHSIDIWGVTIGGDSTSVYSVESCSVGCSATSATFVFNNGVGFRYTQYQNPDPISITSTATTRPVYTHKQLVMLSGTTTVYPLIQANYTLTSGTGNFLVHTAYFTATRIG